MTSAFRIDDKDGKANESDNDKKDDEVTVSATSTSQRKKRKSPDMSSDSEEKEDALDDKKRPDFDAIEWQRGEFEENEIYLTPTALRIRYLLQRYYANKNSKNFIPRKKNYASYSISISYDGPNSSRIRRSLRSFLKRNGERCMNPTINACKRSESEAVLIHAADAFSIEKLTEETAHTPALVGQFGLKSNVFISKHEIILPFLGTYYTESEWAVVFGDSDELHRRNCFSFYIDVDTMYARWRDLDNMIIDGIGYADTQFSRSQNLMAFVNDCRMNISTKQLTAAEKKLCNCQFVKASVNGFPMIFLMTVNVISKGEQLLAFYGANYTDFYAEMSQ